MGQVYSSAFTKEQAYNVFSSAGTLAVQAGKEYRLMEFKVEAGINYSFGEGFGTNYEDAIGRIFMDIRDNTAAPGAQVSGMVRLLWLKPSKKQGAIIREYHTSKLSSGETDARQQCPFPLQDQNGNWSPLVSEDKYLAIEFIPDNDVTLSYANSKGNMSVTIEED
jgi:hypothetical protein